MLKSFIKGEACCQKADCCQSSPLPSITAFCLPRALPLCLNVLITTTWLTLIFSKFKNSRNSLFLPVAHPPHRSSFCLGRVDGVEGCAPLGWSYIIHPLQFLLHKARVELLSHSSRITRFFSSLGEEGDI